jgi:hypothetical protein
VYRLVHRLEAVHVHLYILVSVGRDCQRRSSSTPARDRHRAQYSPELSALAAVAIIQQLLTLGLYSGMYLCAGNWLRYTLCWQSMWQCARHNTVQQGQLGLGSVNVTDTAPERLVPTSYGAAICANSERDRAGRYYWQQDGGTQGELSTIILYCAAVVRCSGYC